MNELINILQTKAQQVKRISVSSVCFVFIALLVGLTMASCTKDLTGDLPDYGTSSVVDGNIETNRPPVIVLTRSTKVFGDLNVNDLSSFLLHNALVTMTIDNDTTPILLPELCLRTFTGVPDSLKRSLLYSLGVTVYDSASVPDVCVYTLSIAELANYYNSNICPHCGIEGHQYNIRIRLTTGRVITASTTIPHALGLQALGIRPVPGNDSLVNVTATLSVPATVGNFIRYWTRRNYEPFYTPFSGSVYDDKLFAGQTLTLPLERGIPGYVSNPDPATFGYFWKGDTVTVKWANIDSRTYDFYNTLENDGGGSPFSSPVRVKSNVVGDSAIGVWAGYGSRYYTIAIPK